MRSNGNDGLKWMVTGQPNELSDDITGHIIPHVATNNDGWGEFMCVGGKVLVWLPARYIMKKYTCSSMKTIATNRRTTKRS